YLPPEVRPRFNLNRNFNKIFRNEDPLAYHSKLRKYEPTPLISLSKLAKSIGIKELYLKDESTRFRQNTFKILGASFAIHKFLESSPGKYTFCTATDGNHGRSVAWAARRNNQKAVIYVPEHTAKARVKSIRKQRARVVVVKGDYDVTVLQAREDAQKHGYILIQDTSWEGYTEIPTIIATGYKTMLLELEELLHTRNDPKIDFVFLQAGVGTWASSVVAYYRNKYPRCMPKIIIVEPMESDSLLESCRNQNLSKTKGSQETVMAGLNCGTASRQSWEILNASVDLFLAIPDDYAIKAMQDLYFPFKNDTQIFAGESGAAGLGGLLALAHDESLKEVREKIGLNEKSRVLIFNTEGVTDPESFDELISREIEM
ncbi:MAG: diaminopropionate ammonia-lyase, partial [Bacteroidales bacterium]|nr:diaminopropionate ammonia-lyase [Bacteroidales bacterium]